MFGRDIEAITHVLLVSSTSSETPINRPVEIPVSIYARGSRVFISSNVTLKNSKLTNILLYTIPKRYLSSLYLIYIYISKINFKFRAFFANESISSLFERLMHYYYLPVIIIRVQFIFSPDKDTARSNRFKKISHSDLRARSPFDISNREEGRGILTRLIKPGLRIRNCYVSGDRNG